MLLFPSLVKHANSRWQTTVRSINQTAILMMAACAAASICARPAIGLVFGPQFLPSAEVLTWMLPGVLAYSLTMIVSQFLSARGVPPVLIGIWCIGLVVLLTANHVLLPRYAASGAAMAFSLASTVVFALELGLAWKLRREDVALPAELTLSRKAA
jgi:O-antigen/teichoic acid export membrane protein